MNRLRLLVVFCCAVWLGCSSDGGPVGTGISSTSAISGNIVAVQTTGTVASDSTAPLLPPITVSIDGVPDARTMADSGGNFVLSGDFEGALTLRFTVPQYQVTQPLDVPAGSAIVLQDIELQPEGVIAQAARQLDFFGIVDMIDCADGTLLIHERGPEGRQFLVHLDDGTSYVDAAGGAQTCAAIGPGRAVDVEGSIAYESDRTITALVVTIAPPPPPPPQKEVDARFAGNIAALDCAAGFVVVDDSDDRTAVKLTPQTRLSGPGGALACRDLRLGSSVHGEGQINLRMPGVIVASRLMVTGPPQSEQPLRFVGAVVTIDCASGRVQLTDDRTTIAVLVSATTMITRRNGQPLMCTDIQPGDRVDGVGQLDADGSGTVDAMQMRVGHHGGRGPG